MNLWKRVGNVWVHAYSVLSAPCVVYVAAEKYARHETFVRGPRGEPLGTIASRPLPSELLVLPQDSDRWGRIDAFRAANDEAAWTAIVTAFPEARRGKRQRGMGQVERWRQP